MTAGILLIKGNVTMNYFTATQNVKIFLRSYYFALGVTKTNMLSAHIYGVKI